MPTTSPAAAESDPGLALPPPSAPPSPPWSQAHSGSSAGGGVSGGDDDAAQEEVSEQLASLEGMLPSAQALLDAMDEESRRAGGRGGGDDDGAEAATEDLLQQETISRRLRAWWRFKRRQASADHEHMPCWKAYTVLFVGSIFVALSTITVVTLFSIVEPITQFFVVFSFAGSVPSSIVLHFAARAAVRHLRKLMALRRGTRVEGVWEAAMKQQQKGRRVRFKEGGAGGDAAREYDAEAARALRRLASAHVGSSAIDAMQSLADRRNDGFAASTASSHPSADQPDSSLLRVRMGGLPRIGPPRSRSSAGDVEAPTPSPGAAAAAASSPATAAPAFSPAGASDLEAATASAPAPAAKAVSFKPGRIVKPVKASAAAPGPATADESSAPHGKTVAFGEQRAPTRGTAQERGRRILSAGISTSAAGRKEDPPVAFRV